jgi:hypothetical protein
VWSGTIQGVSELTVQLHSRSALIASVPEPPSEGNELGEVVAKIAHLGVGAVVTDVVDDVQPLTSSAIVARMAIWHRTALALANTLPGTPSAVFAQAFSWLPQSRVIDCGSAIVSAHEARG